MSRDYDNWFFVEVADVGFPLGLGPIDCPASRSWIEAWTVIPAGQHVSFRSAGSNGAEGSCNCWGGESAAAAVVVAVGGGVAVVSH